MKTEMFRFETASFVVRATVQEDSDVDVSFDETSETRDKLNSGEWQAFGTIVTVEHNGRVLGESSLWGSIYAKPAEFFDAHRAPDPMERNCSIMRAAKGRVAICHYFPDMVREAIGEARKTLATMPKLRK
jgi:hypothetical protein